MPRLLASPVYQQTMTLTLENTRDIDLNDPRYNIDEKWFKCKYIFMYFLNKIQCGKGLTNSHIRWIYSLEQYYTCAWSINKLAPETVMPVCWLCKHLHFSRNHTCLGSIAFRFNRTGFRLCKRKFNNVIFASRLLMIWRSKEQVHQS